MNERHAEMPRENWLAGPLCPFISCSLRHSFSTEVTAGAAPTPDGM